MAIDTSNRERLYTIPAGELWLFDFVGNNPLNLQGGRYLGNSKGFDIGFSTSSFQHKDADHGPRNIDLDIITDIDRVCNIILSEMEPENIAMYVLGDSFKRKTTAMTPEPETITVKQNGLYLLGVAENMPTGAFGLKVPASGESTPSFSIKPKTAPSAPSEDNPAVYEEGRDYQVDYDLGQIFIEAGGRIANGDPSVSSDGLVSFDTEEITVVYSIVATERDQIVSKEVQRTGRLYYKAFNKRGQQLDYVIPKATFMPDGALDLKTDELVELSLKATILDPGYGMHPIYCDGAPIRASQTS